MHAPPNRTTIGANDLTVFLCGDVMTGRGVDQVLPVSCPPRLKEPYVTSALDYVALAEEANGPIPRPVPYSYVWGVALEVLERVRPHLRIINLETSITTSEDLLPKGINYRMHPANAPILRVAGIDCSVLANNHVLDWGAGGLVETLSVLAGAGITTAGAGRDLAEARAPAVLEAGDRRRVLVFALGAPDSGIPPSWGAGASRPGIYRLPDFSAASVDEVARAVETARRPGDVAVASIHWGGNWGYDVPAEHRHFGHALIDRAGIDLIHGHSSHHPKGMELYRERLILYGCGDFISDYEGITGYETFRDDLVLMYFPTVEPGTGRLVRIEMVPLQVSSMRLNHPTPWDRAWIEERLDRECQLFGHRVRRHGASLVLE